MITTRSLVARLTRLSARIQAESDQARLLPLVRRYLLLNRRVRRRLQRQHAGR
jgi:hypothetical protein